MNTTLMLVGDIMLSRNVNKKIKKYGPLFPFEKISSVLKQGDIIFGNLECPISEQGTALKKKYTFKAEPDSIKGLIFADIVSLANNHILDYGSIAVKNTKKILKDNNIKFTGLKNKEEINQKPAIIEKQGKKIGFLAYTMIFPNTFKDLYPMPFPFIEKNVLKDIKNAKKQVDFLIVSNHWGEEYSFKANENQKRIGRLMIDNGADIIAGHHPHVLQPIEEYNKGVIFYSLGNFVFDQRIYEGVKDSIILKISVDSSIKKIEKIPIHINDNFQPCLK